MNKELIDNVGKLFEENMMEGKTLGCLAKNSSEC